jgi:hypothetical protein
MSGGRTLVPSIVAPNFGSDWSAAGAVLKKKACAGIAK